MQKKIIKIKLIKNQIYRSWIISLSFASFILCSCSAMLPSAEMKVMGPWLSYENAEQTFSEIIPQKTTTLDLVKINLDPRKNSNITLLNYSDIIRRFIPPGNIYGFELDSNLVDCISNGFSCFERL